MIEKTFRLFNDFAENHKKLIFGLIGLLNLAAIAGLFFAEFENNVEIMLPDNKEISRTIGFLRDSNLSNKIIISLSLTSPAKGKKDLIRAVDQLVSSLDPSLFSEVNYGLSDFDITESLDFFLDKTPQLLNSRDLADFDSQINSETIARNLKNIYRQALTLGGIFINKMVRSDPLGLKLITLNKLRRLSANLGYKVNMEDGHFISQDGKHAMIIARTPVLVTDIFGARKLLGSLERQFQKLPGYISADIISGHTHTLSNEKLMRRDILLCSVITSIAFLVLFLVVLKDAGTIIIFLVPLSSVILSVNLCYFLLGRLSYSVIGLGSVLAGISVDHAIHVYVSVRMGNIESVKHVSAPVLAGTLTTIAAFAAFFFSDVKGYHQLAFFSISGISLAVIYSLFILPFALSKKSSESKKNRIKKFGNFSLSSKYSLIFWAFFSVIFLFLSFKVRFDNDIEKIDGTSLKIKQAEKQFSRTWGHKKQAVLVVTGDSYQKALELNDLIYQEAIQIIDPQKFTSLAMLWPSKKTRTANAAGWKKFWKEEREEKLKKYLEEEGIKYQFSKEAFSPFFENLYKETTVNDRDTDNKFLDKLKERFVQKRQGKYQILSFFPDQAAYVKAISKLSLEYPQTFLVSGIVLSNLISDGSSRNIKLMAPVAAVLVVLLTYFCMGNIIETVIALVPVFTSIVWLFGLMAVLGLTLNVANVIACIVLLGICVDYGIFVIYKYRSEVETGTNTAVTLAALTTICGAGALIFASHPALFSVGIAMVIGVGTGYLSSVSVVPQLVSIFLNTEKKKQLG